MSQTDWRAEGGADALMLEAVCRNPKYFKVRPRRGAALLFFNLRPSGVQDVRMQYGECPVVAVAGGGPTTAAKVVGVLLLLLLLLSSSSVGAVFRRGYCLVCGCCCFC